MTHDRAILQRCFLVFLCGMFTALAVISVTLHFHYKSMREKQERQTHALARQINEYVVQKLIGCQQAIARMPIVAKALSSPDADSEKELDIVLNTTRLNLGASLVYLLNQHGTVIAGTLFGENISLVGNDYGFRPYFLNAIAGNDTIYPAMGVTTNEQGFYVSAPVIRGNDQKPIGVIVLKEDSKKISAILNGYGEPAMLVSPDGAIFLSSVRKWEFHILHSITDEQREKIVKTRQFANNPLPAIGFKVSDNKTSINGISYGIVEVDVAIKELDGRTWRLATLQNKNRDFPYNAVIGIIICILGLIIAAIAYIVLSHHKEHLKVKIALSDKQLRKTSAQLEKGMEELEKTQEALIRAERMAAMGTLAGGVAHEFNNINTAILGFSEIVLLQTDLDEETLDCLERIRKAALRSASITRNLLTFSGSKKGDPVSTDIKEVITETIDLVDRDLEKDKVTLETDLKPVPMSVMDGSQIGQVILNLLINAKHALTGRKHKKLRVSSTVQDGCILVSVSDNGCGISKENIREIFTPFYSTKGEHAPKGSPHAEIKGTGLGLCVSETIMRKHNGDIIVESEIDKGTTFTLKLPIVRGRESERTRPRERKQSVAGKIVAVEDEPDTRDLLSLLLNRCGHDAFLTESGHQALEYIKENGDIDLLLADLRMSEMSGMELLEEIAKLPVDIRPKVIVVSGQLGPEEMRGLEEFEVFDKVLKPFEIDHLMERVDEAIRQKRLFQQ